ncbi:putative membrane protein, partial [Plasmodium gaboni]
KKKYIFIHNNNKNKNKNYYYYYYYNMLKYPCGYHTRSRNIHLYEKNNKNIFYIINHKQEKNNKETDPIEEYNYYIDLKKDIKLHFFTSIIIQDNYINRNKYESRHSNDFDSYSYINNYQHKNENYLNNYSSHRNISYEYGYNNINTMDDNMTSLKKKVNINEYDKYINNVMNYKPKDNKIDVNKKINVEIQNNISSILYNQRDNEKTKIKRKIKRKNDRQHNTYIIYEKKKKNAHIFTLILNNINLSINKKYTYNESYHIFLYIKDILLLYMLSPEINKIFFKKNINQNKNEYHTNDLNVDKKKKNLNTENDKCVNTYCDNNNNNNNN